MADTTTTAETDTTAPAPVYGPLQFNVTPPPFATEFDALRELTQAQERARSAEEANATLVAEVARLSGDQIVDGGDPRLARFWERAGRIADYAGFCEEYDRMADELNGTPRVREWAVRFDITVTVPVTVYVNAQTEDDARELGDESLGRTSILEALTSGQDFDYESEIDSTERV